jgi:hypothetical protein
MALVTLNLNPSEKQLKTFGLITPIMCSLVGLILLRFGKIPLRGLLLLVIFGILLYVLGRISTKLIKPVFLTMTFLTFPIGWVVSHLVMALFYYGIITPVAIFFRLLNRDPLCRRYEPDADTYWIPYKHKRSAKDYFRQF